MRFFYKFDYAIRNSKGEIVDSSAGGEALTFVDGEPGTIPGLQKALQDRAVGDEFQVTIEPEDAYGWPRRALIRTVSRDMFDTDVADVEVGMIVQVGSGNSIEVVKVVSVDEEGITVDANHPLAGVTFDFEIKVLEARPASDEEIEHSLLKTTH